MHIYLHHSHSSNFSSSLSSSSSSSSRADSTEFPNSLSFVTPPYQLSLLASPLNHTLCPYRTEISITPAHLCGGVNERISLMSSSLLLQQCPAYLVRLTWMISEMWGKQTNSRCFIGSCYQEFLKKHIIFLCDSHQAYLYSFHLNLGGASIQYTYTATARKKSHRIHVLMYQY